MSTTTCTAIDAFMDRKSEALALVDAIRAFLSDDFTSHVAPDEIHWGHVGDLERWIELLNRIDLAGWDA